MSLVVSHYKEHWNGIAPLWSAFWIHWVLFPICFMMAGIVILEKLGDTTQFGIIIGISLMSLAYVYQLVASLFVWRCSIAREHQEFGFLARVLALSGPFLVALDLVASGIAALVS